MTSNYYIDTDGTVKQMGSYVGNPVGAPRTATEITQMMNAVSSASSADMLSAALLRAAGSTHDIVVEEMGKRADEVGAIVRCRKCGAADQTLVLKSALVASVDPQQVMYQHVAILIDAVNKKECR